MHGELTVHDWKHLMRQTPAGVGDTSMFDNALCLFPTMMSVAEYNVAKLHVNGQPVAGIKAVHSGLGASKSSADDDLWCA